MSPFLSATEAKAQTAQVNDRRLEPYRQIKHRCQAAVKLAIARNRTNTIYTVPAVLPGYASYDAYAIATHLRELLERRGYQTKHVGPLQIAISWRAKGEKLPRVAHAPTSTSCKHTLLVRMKNKNATRGIY